MYPWTQVRGRVLSLMCPISRCSVVRCVDAVNYVLFEQSQQCNQDVGCLPMRNGDCICFPDKRNLRSILICVYACSYASLQTAINCNHCRVAAAQEPIPRVALLRQEELSLRKKIAASKFRHQVAQPGEAKGIVAGASLLEQMSSFRLMGTLYVLKDFLAILNEMNKPFQYRLLTYNGIVADVERAKRNLTMQFLGDSGVKMKAYWERWTCLILRLGGFSCLHMFIST